MKNILIHGLGQNNHSWDKTRNYLKDKGLNTICPNLFDIINNNFMDYRNLYNSFANYCNSHDGRINLCGLSLGGLLALDFVKEYPNKVNSIIIIGTTYKIPKILFKIQSIIFHIMPKRTFEKMGCSKRNFITLVSSMSNLNITKDLETISCKSLIICGSKDNINIESAKTLSNCIANSELKIISNSSHEINIDNPEELSNVIYDFWKDKKQ